MITFALYALVGALAFGGGSAPLAADETMLTLPEPDQSGALCLSEEAAMSEAAVDINKRPPGDLGGICDNCCPIPDMNNCCECCAKMVGDDCVEWETVCCP
jgi:hypothetical protein